MSERRQNFEPPHAFTQLESVVRAARGYVQPTEDLRPRTIEAAREASQLGRSRRRLASLTAIVLLLAATGFPGSMLSSNPDPAFTNSSELHRLAAKSAMKRGVGPNWALYEVFSKLRRDQADLLNHSD